MALIRHFGKVGRIGLERLRVSNFSRLFKLPIPRYGVSTMQDNKPITIRDLYPHMSEEDLAVAEANLKRYAAVIVRIYERLKAEGKSWPKG
jgi:hypothetical protein